MKIQCKHGFFLFEEEFVGEAGRFMTALSVELESYGDYFTFPYLVDAKDYSLVGSNYLNLPAIATYEGEPWEVMRENGFVYSLLTNILIPIDSVMNFVALNIGDFYYSSEGLIQPGSFMQNSQKVSSYTAWFDWKSGAFRYSEVKFL